MRLVHIAAGAGGMYCGACARDLALARGMIALGHDLEIVPLYTPIRDDSGESVPTGPLFYSGITVFLRQISRFFRQPPQFLERVLASSKGVALLSRMAVEVRPEKLGPMTVSVLAGQDGAQARDLSRLLEYLEGSGKPQVVSLTNSLLSGIAPEVKRRLRTPIICSLQGEESFIERIPEPHRSQALRLLRKNAEFIDRFVAPFEAYAVQMADYLGISSARIGVVRPGIDAGRYQRMVPANNDRFTIATLSTIVPAKGLDLLVEAFISLVRERGRDVRLRVAGKVLNPGYWRRVRARVTQSGLGSRFEYLGEVDFAGKRELLHNADVFCLPSRIAETRGIVVMEALAAGVPVVVPNHGVFPSLLGDVGGGMVVQNAVPAITDGIERLMDDPAERQRLAEAGAEGIARRYTVEGMARAFVEQLEQLKG